jgi:hypothetical protein
MKKNTMMVTVDQQMVDIINATIKSQLEAWVGIMHECLIDYDIHSPMLHKDALAMQRAVRQFLDDWQGLTVNSMLFNAEFQTLMARQAMENYHRNSAVYDTLEFTERIESDAVHELFKQMMQ